MVVASRRAGHRRPARHDPAEHGRSRRAASWAGNCSAPPASTAMPGSKRSNPRRSTRHSRAARSRSSRASRACQRRRPAGDARAAADPTPRRSRSPRGSRPTAATSTPTSTASTPPTRASCPGRASSTQVTFEEMLELAGVGAKVLQTRSVGLAMRENLPLRVLSAFEDLARDRDRRRTVRSEHGTQPDRRHRRRQE